MERERILELIEAALARSLGAERVHIQLVYAATDADAVADVGTEAWDALLENLRRTR